MKSILKIFLIFLITLVLIEFSAPFLLKTKNFTKGLPSWVTLYADEETSFWHPTNVTFELEKADCWKSTVTYNNIGMRQLSDIFNEKKKKRIALLGDSMIESIELSDGYDLTNKLQNELFDFEILNFSVRGTGLADQIDIYKKLIVKYDVDYLILFVTENDFFNNFFDDTEKNMKSYKVINGQIVEVDRNKEFFLEYNSKKNRTKRYLSKYLKNTNIYKVYLGVISSFKKNKIREQIDVEENFNLLLKEKYQNNFDKKKSIYVYLKNKLIKEIGDDINFNVILNLKSYSFVDENLSDEKIFIKNNVINFLKNTWNEYDEFDPTINAKEFLINNNAYRFPYLNMKCDEHYSSLGTDFYTYYVKKLIGK